MVNANIKRIFFVILIFLSCLFVGGFKVGYYASYLIEAKDVPTTDDIYDGPKFAKDERFIIIHNYNDLKKVYERYTGKDAYKAFNRDVMIRNFAVFISFHAPGDSQMEFSNLIVKEKEIHIDIKNTYTGSFADYQPLYFALIIIPRWQMPVNFKYKPNKYKLILHPSKTDLYKEWYDRYI